MARIVLYSFFLCWLSYGVSQNKYVESKLFCEGNILKHLRSLSSDAFEGRRTGTKGGLKAQKYIINQFFALNVKPLVKDYRQPFRFVHKGSYYNGVNILGCIKGTLFPSEYIVISAHYDHEGINQGEIFNGADDNASGVSALFAFGEYFRQNPPKHSVILAAFDAEELDIQGSKYYMKNPVVKLENIVLNLNMDMISRSDQQELFVAGTSYNTQLKALFKEEVYSTNINLLLGHDGYDGLDNWTYASDHVNFYKKGISFLYFGVEDHKDYHEPTDTFEKIHTKFYIESVRTIIKVFKSVDNLEF
ncbi:M28 family peptidase [Cognatitamlana onchidii]|uniref:M28 family peptidase n=1 Tax=Cognatitamlana onchidii TaxID=2562860 RepID=UPI0010A5A845|nr:M28 family peptidase [Algibacter onchidii]